MASTSLSIGYDSRALAVGRASTSLTAAVAPANADQRVIWTSSAPAVATVDGSGRVTAVSAGISTITATTTDGRTATLTLTVVTAEADLLLRYSFDGLDATTDGSRVTDVSGRGHDATIRGAGATTAAGARMWPGIPPCRSGRSIGLERGLRDDRGRGGARRHA